MLPGRPLANEGRTWVVQPYIFLLALRHSLMNVLRSSLFLSLACVLQTFISCLGVARLHLLLLGVAFFSSAADAIESDPTTTTRETAIANSVLLCPSSPEVGNDGPILEAGVMEVKGRRRGVPSRHGGHETPPRGRRIRGCYRSGVLRHLHHVDPAAPTARQTSGRRASALAAGGTRMRW